MLGPILFVVYTHTHIYIYYTHTSTYLFMDPPQRDLPFFKSYFEEFTGICRVCCLFLRLRESSKKRGVFPSKDILEASGTIQMSVGFIEAH